MQRTDAAGRRLRIAPPGAIVGVLLAASLAAAPAMAASHGAGASAFAARGSVAQVDVTGARPGARLTLVDRRGRRVAARSADPLGSALFRGVRPGPGYVVRLRAGARVLRSARFTVLPDRSAPPSTRIYSQRIPADGYGYLSTRDGTRLAIDVHQPGPVSGGPYPTLIEYSGYGYADPAGGQSSIAQIANALGFTVVDVNMRGTGCSGGAYDYFEPLQGLDGYDVIETVARQPWVRNHKVGMMGISFGAISQLFVAETDPPDLAAIAPLSTIDDSATTLYPGGLLNSGFALTWAQQRVHDARPASATGGQPWALKQIASGDRTCRANQALHGEAVNLVAKIHANRYYVRAVADPLAPTTFVKRIRVPVYLACQWTDEQTGGHCPDLAEHFTGTQRKWFTFTNGTHIDSLDPATFNRWYDFLELFVARRAPSLPAAVLGLSPLIYSTAMGIDGVGLPPDPLQVPGASYGTALAAFERLPEVRVLFDNGAGGATPGLPLPGFEQSFSQFPAPGTRPASWYLGAGGALAPAPGGGGADVFAWRPAARPVTSFSGDTSSGPGGLWTATPVYHWTQSPPGAAVSYVSAPLAANTTVVGAGALTAWVRSNAAAPDLQVTVSEVRPDGIETFVQDGWLRTSGRRLDRRRSTLLAPVPSLRRADAAPLPRGRFTAVTVPLYYEGHVYRAGSRIRVAIAAPGGDQPVWAFREPAGAGVSVTVAHSPAMPSRLVLPVVPGVAVPTGLPPCPGLRGEPCRPYVPLVNRSAG